jgi:hypothetical protein
LRCESRRNADVASSWVKDMAFGVGSSGVLLLLWLLLLLSSSS